MRIPELTLLVFKSGKINFVGARNRYDIFVALEKVYPILCKYKNIIIKKEKSEDFNEPEFSDINNI